MQRKNYKKVVLQPLFILVGIILFYGLNTQPGHAQTVSCGKGNNITDFTVTETSTNRFQTYTYIETDTAFNSCERNLSASVQLLINTLNGWEKVDELFISGDLIYDEYSDRCIREDTINFTIQENGQYQIALVPIANPTTFAPMDHSCVVPIEVNIIEEECNASLACRQGEAGGCFTEQQFCILDTEDNEYRCAYENDPAVESCRESINCGGNYICQRGALGGCENDNEICVAVAEASAFTCVELDHPNSIEQCSGTSCLPYGSDCTPGGVSCCRDITPHQGEGRCLPVGEKHTCGSYVAPADPFGSQDRGERCPTCDDDYGDPDVLLDILYRISVPAAIILGLFMIVTCGYKIMTTHGDPRQLQDAKECVTSAIIGLLFIMLSVSILRLVISSIITEI